MKIGPSIALLLLCGASFAQQPELDSISRKLEHIQQNADATPIDSSPTEFKEAEINAYVASENVTLPQGVKSVNFRGQPGVITATAHVDFDEVKAGRASINPLLSVFNGVHEIEVVAHAQGGGHEGVVHVDRVSLDGVEIPRFVLQQFVEKFLEPKYPKVGLDSRFELPQKIDTATVGERILTVTQK